MRNGRRLHIVVCLAWLAVVIGVSSAGAGQQAAPPAATSPRAASATLTRQDRIDLLNALVDKWAAHVQVTHGQDPEIWRDRLMAWARRVDDDNLRRALTQKTYDDAMAALVGRVARADAPAVADSRGDVDDPQAIAARLGDLTTDLTYTPLTPCRIVDTRSTGLGAIAANSVRNFVALTASNFSSQGGSATTCGTNGMSATAVAINITAVTPGAAGYATVFPWGTAQPLASSVNYTAGAIVNNGIITRIPFPLGTFDFSIYTLAQSHYVVDIVGFFAPNEATPLECSETAQDETLLSGGATASAIAPACPTGYIMTGTQCQAATTEVNIFVQRNGVCTGRNSSGSTVALRASKLCCRVPGR